MSLAKGKLTTVGICTTDWAQSAKGNLPQKRQPDPVALISTHGSRRWGKSGGFPLAYVLG